MKSKIERYEDYIKIAALNGTLKNERYVLNNGGQIVLEKVSENVSNTFVVPDFVDSIGGYAFDKCQDVTEVKTYGTLKFIGYCAFSGCKNMRKIELAEGLLNIQSRAFDWCFNLEELIIPESVDTVGDCFSSFGKAMKLLSIKGVPKHMDYIIYPFIKDVDTIIINKKNKRLVREAGKYNHIQWV